MKITTLLITSMAVLTLASCKNPADSTPDASVKEAEAEAVAEGGQRYEFSPSSTIGFVGSKVTGSHEGGFKQFTGHFLVNKGKPQAGEFVIDMNSTWSDAEKLTGHLKAPDFFDVANHPQSTFKVTAFKQESPGAYVLSGNLTLRGVTKNITFPTQVSGSEDAVRIKAEFDINRQDFGIAYPGRKDDLIRDEVIIKLDLEAKPGS
ncbi:MAG: YceI family protein [Akkermansiaceae bacterium]